MGADYVLSGYIEGASREPRIVIELADALTDTVVWTSECDLTGGSDDDLCQVLKRNLIPLLLLKISGHESGLSAQKPTDQLTAWEAYHRGVTELHRLTADANMAAIQHLQRAVALDPGFSIAYAALSVAWECRGSEMIRDQTNCSMAQIAVARAVHNICRTALTQDAQHAPLHPCAISR